MLDFIKYIIEFIYVFFFFPHLHLFTFFKHGHLNIYMVAHCIFLLGSTALETPQAPHSGIQALTWVFHKHFKCSMLQTKRIIFLSTLPCSPNRLSPFTVLVHRQLSAALPILEPWSLSPTPSFSQSLLLVNSISCMFLYQALPSLPLFLSLFIVPLLTLTVVEVS